MIGFRALVVAWLAISVGLPVHAQPVHSIEWDDGDSGTINDVDFRLADVDAPESRPVGSLNGAKCEKERSSGRLAKDWVVEVTRGKSLVITGRDPKIDDFGRVVLTLSVDGQDLGDLGVAADRYHPYIFDNGKARFNKPLWCG